MNFINELPNEIHFNVIKFMSHPVADLMKHRINSYLCNKCNNMFYNFYDYWKYDVKLFVESKEVKRCRWCMTSFQNGHKDLHECHECKLHHSTIGEDEYEHTCSGCKDIYCYTCLMRRKDGKICTNVCKGCKCAIYDYFYDLCHDCEMSYW